ncbi:hypothetical protein [Aeromonas caviae]|uniref:hypothetical protein n=1 Tax=Aeromonas caviae TaxID=648 RepID=UPI00192026B8|nr:hypothetical protein [Aeromonas caviae]MBL0517725.1 hypothetical protein [Aeromonas caviae]
MHNRKIENLKELFVLKESIPVSFDDLLKSPNIEGILSDLIFLVGYNFITYERSSDGHIKFQAGMFYDESDEKLTFDGMVLQGNLLLAVKTVYNVYVDIQLQSNIIDFYSQEMREKIIDSIILKNKIDRFFFNHLQHRMAF